MLVFMEYPIWELQFNVGIYRISDYGNYNPMLVFIEYPIWKLQSNVGIYRISDMGITIQCWYL